MRKRILCSLFLLAPALGAQEILSERVKGLRVYGSDQAGLPVAGMQSRPITIEFDVVEESAPDVRLRVLHCDRDWNVTQNNFINDNMQNKSKEALRYEPAPAGTQFYRFHYVVSIPGISGLDRFTQSGNYIFEITDREWVNVLARGRFFVTEGVIAPSMKVTNRSLPSEINPYNQVNRIEIAFVIPPRADDQSEILFPINFRTVDLYRNRQLYTPWRIDADDSSPNTFIDGFGTSKMKFIVDNVTPGTSYRRIDVRNVDEYPEGSQLRARRGADVSRFQLPAKGDSHGTSTLTQGSRYADYVPFRFELASETRQFESVYVVGDFNGWRLSPDCLMVYDVETGRYIWQTTIRRGAYDYQYVVGPNDWISLEGNDWRTINLYSALVYYRDSRYGGFDRIIGFIQRSSPGGNQPTSD
ncbi:MAG: DUF5103 domain-containing protein [Ignavibacteriales bacterium]|nr:DUF5103 domain-containing protein [Ignavibacteriales bacterium]